MERVATLTARPDDRFPNEVRLLELTLVARQAPTSIDSPQTTNVPAGIGALHRRLAQITLTESVKQLHPPEAYKPE